MVAALVSAAFLRFSFWRRLALILSNWSARKNQQRFRQISLHSGLILPMHIDLSLFCNHTSTSFQNTGIRVLMRSEPSACCGLRTPQITSHTQSRKTLLCSCPLRMSQRMRFTSRIERHCHAPTRSEQPNPIKVPLQLSSHLYQSRQAISWHD